MVVLDRVNLVEPLPHRGDHLTIVCSGLYQNAKTVTVGVLTARRAALPDAVSAAVHRAASSTSSRDNVPRLYTSRKTEYAAVVVEKLSKFCLGLHFMTRC